MKKEWHRMRNEERLEFLRTEMAHIERAVDGQAQMFRLPQNFPTLAAMAAAIEQLEERVADLSAEVAKLRGATSPQLPGGKSRPQ